MCTIRNDEEKRQVRSSEAREIKWTKVKVAEMKWRPGERLSENSPLTSLKAALKTCPLCQTVEQTELLFCSFFSFFFFFSSESTALSKSSPDFQLLSLVVVPDKQNLLDQADFTAAPAHMAASVAHFLSSGFFFFFLPPPISSLSFYSLYIRLTRSSLCNYGNISEVFKVFPKCLYEERGLFSFFFSS